jgi:hypothetical protein
MIQEIKAPAKKIISLLIMFNSLVSVISSLSIVYSVFAGYASNSVYRPYLFSTFLLISLTLTGALNIVPARIMGMVNIRRFLFHHYVYGFIALLISFTVALLSPILFHNLAYLTIYLSITLILDDISDISPKIRNFLDNLKARVSGLSGVIMRIHMVSSVIAAYVTSSIILWYIGNGVDGILHAAFIANISITTAYGLGISCGKTWIKHFNGASNA